MMLFYQDNNSEHCKKIRSMNYTNERERYIMNTMRRGTVLHTGSNLRDVMVIKKQKNNGK